MTSDLTMDYFTLQF